MLSKSLVLAMLLLIGAAHSGTAGAPRGKPLLAHQVARGEQVFERWCSACHAPGPGHPGTQALQVKYQGTPPAPLQERTDLAPETTKYFVRNGISLMSFFRKTEISDADLEALAQYLDRPAKYRRK